MIAKKEIIFSSFRLLIDGESISKTCEPDYFDTNIIILYALFSSLWWRINSRDIFKYRPISYIDLNNWEECCTSQIAQAFHNS